MTKEALLQRLSDIEWDDFEVKEASHGLPKNVWETVSAFANSAGGWIVFGVEQRGKKFEIAGVGNAEKLEQDFVTVLRNRNKFNVLISPKCKKYTINECTVLAFYIGASEQKPVYYNSLNNTFIRKASGDQRATESEINAMLRDQLFGHMSARPAEKTTLNDLNKTTLYRYRDYMSRFNPGLSYNAMLEEEFLERLQITDGNRLTYGGLLFMGKNLAINKSFPDFRIDLLEIPGKSYAEAAIRYTFRLEEQENLWEYYFAIIDRLKRHIDMPFKMNELGIAIEDSPQFDAIREALVNMLMHSDYFSVIKPRVRVFSDRIEFENPGAFPRPLDELMKKDVSIPRNPVLAKLFRCAKLAENAGYGFDKMLKWEKSTHAKVVFENNIDVSLVTFSLGEITAEVEYISEEGTEEGTEKGTEENPEKDTERSTKGTEKGTEKITGNQQLIMDSIAKNPYITSEELSDIVKIRADKIRINISKLKTKGFIQRIGPDKGGQWIILKQYKKDTED
ncbi:MAG: putative DNA binding domain-containing protein [Prevotellaceae bacterium]|jgi:ATP-dependent DNA helicase RecG|nr:putative DNA binding domain-containing protein [Prevotellaceae bacterium]